MEKENKLEKSSRNENDDSSFLIIGAVVEALVPGTGALFVLGGGCLGTYVLKPLNDKIQDFQTPLKEMPLYAVKNSIRGLMGATTISALRYLL